MAVERHIVTENQARDFLGLPRTSPEWTPFFMGDTGYLGAIEMASRKCEEHIGNKIALQEISSYILDGTDSLKLCLPYYPIVRISGNAPGTKANLQYRDTVAGGWLDIFSTQADFEAYLFIDPIENWKLEILEGVATFPYGRRNLKVSWFAGYETIPGEITQVCLEMIADLRNQFAITADGNTGLIGKNRLGLSSMSDSLGGGSSTTSFLNMNDRWAKMLSPYRKLVP